MRVVLAVLVLAACHKPWIQHACDWSLAPDRDALLFAAEDAVVLRRGGTEHRVAFAGCLAGGKDLMGVVALGDGWSALAWGYRLAGGSLWHGGGRLEDPWACRVDFRTKTAAPVDLALLADRMRHLELRAGKRYVYGVGRTGVRVIDLANRRHAHLQVDHAALVETGDRLRVVSPSHQQIAAQPIYRTTVVVNDFDLSAWPPVAQPPRLIPIGGHGDRFVLSDDGNWLAYSGSPYYVGREHQGPIADWGLVDLRAGTIVVEQLARPGHAYVTDVTGGAVLVAWSPDPYAHDTVEQMAWFDRTGQRGHAIETRASTARWLPARHRVDAIDVCTHVLHDLPPP